MDSDPSRCVILTSVGGRPDTGRDRSGSPQILDVRRIGIRMAFCRAVVLPACRPVPNRSRTPGDPPARAGAVSHLLPDQIGDVRYICRLLNPPLNEEVTVQADGCISAIMVPDQLACALTVPDLDAAPQPTIPRC